MSTAMDNGLLQRTRAVCLSDLSVVTERKAIEEVSKHSDGDWPDLGRNQPVPAKISQLSVTSTCYRACP